MSTPFGNIFRKMFPRCRRNNPAVAQVRVHSLSAQRDRICFAISGPEFSTYAVCGENSSMYGLHT